MLTLARESRGMTQKALAEATGLSQAAISKFEAGLVVPDQAKIEKIGCALDYPAAIFYRTGLRLGTSIVHHRRLQAVGIKKLREIEARVNMTRLQLRWLAHGVEVDAHLSSPAVNSDLSAPEEAACIVRSTWRLPLGPVTNVVRSIEAAGWFVLPIDFGSSRVDALSLWDRDLGPILFFDPNKPGERVRFTLAHELGHAILHSEAMPSKETESQAFDFASEFLMPAEQIRSELVGLDLERAAQLKLVWKVSIAALIMRAAKLGVITENRKKYLFTRLSQLGYRKREPGELSTEPPALVYNIARLHLETNGYSISELSERLGISDHELRERFLPGTERHLRAV